MSRMADRLLLALAPPLAAVLIRGLHAVMRTEIIGDEPLRKLWQRGENVILAFWHDQLLLMALGYRGPGARILISQSKDGELIARVMKRLGHEAVRGSSSRGGREAFREMMKLAQEPVDIVFTPDGPRGPRHQLKDGVVQLARMTGRPVVPMAFVASHGHRFGSWDRFLFPYPLARGVYSFGEPVCFDRSEGADGFRLKLEQAMLANQRRAEARLEDYGLSAV
ncbi:MAG: lysophospholipid acyltransferase family protein [Geothermobacteraceae bacterium]